MKSWVIPAMLVFLAACSPAEVKYPGATENTLNWYPLQTGLTQLWLIEDSTFTDTDTLIQYYYRKDSLLEAETDLAGNISWPMDVYTTLPGNDSIFLHSSRETRSIENRFVLEQQGNQKTLVLPLPPQQGARWDALRLSGDQSEYRTITRMDTSISGYPRCLSVLMRYENTLIDYIFGIELYAPGAGKVLSFEKHMEYTFSGNVSVLVQGRATRKTKITA